MSHVSKGYDVAIIGTLSGAVLLGGAGLGLALLYLNFRMPGAGLEGLPLILAGLGTGIISGAVLGCGLFLRYKKSPAAWKTALTAGGLIMIGIFPVNYIANAIYNLSGLGGPLVSLPLMIVLLMLAAWLARRLWTGSA